MVEAVDLWQLDSDPMVGQQAGKVRLVFILLLGGKLHILQMLSLGLQYNQAKERSESGNMDKGNGKEQQGDTQQELAQTLVSLLRSIGGTKSARTVELELGILETSRGREKGSFSGSTSRLTGRRGGPSFSRRGY
ncbi:hypothetical protein HPP92_027494 [Vanilla planifolia]|uniref:Uncharacterized protein n=1 Tax=Vanilla planifolia TaxID=51239 RepID=A0A835PC86_VANPL|nr:hypothetical protein HPP92_027494 [Vanilla planifolia]KAG0449124.1 hypothetical protein HPP92_027511 [Vanilla planifolia]